MNILNLNFLNEQAKLHTYMQPQDVIKLCFQASFGAEHLIDDITAAKRFFDAEFDAVKADNMPLYEQISDRFYRVNIAAWKKAGIAQDWLFEMFALTASLDMAQGNENCFQKHLGTAEKAAAEGVFLFSVEAWLEFKSEYMSKGIRPVHHSELYRNNEKPAYRIVSGECIRLIPILKRLAGLGGDKKSAVIAIDGRCASGKTTMAKQLEKIIGAGVVHMDDFFLPPSLRTKERLEEAGGNVHYERFIDEIIPKITEDTAFFYKIFDCSKMDFDGERQVRPSRWRIAEGAYSCHPILRDYMDVSVFSDISHDVQKDRILRREEEKSAKLFFSRWIPMEEAYLTAFQIRENADIIV